MSESEVLNQCCRVLEKYQRHFTERLRASNQAKQPPAIMLAHGFAFGCQSLKAMHLLLSQDGYEAQACAVCRSFFEIAMRLLWATGEESGWARLQARWAEEDKKLAEDLKNIPSLATVAKESLRYSNEVLVRKDEKGKKIACAPNMRKTLDDISRNDRAEYLKSLVADLPEYLYPMYRGLCRGPHAHISVQADVSKKGMPRLTYRAAVLATGALLLTFVYLIAPVELRNQELEEKAIRTIRDLDARVDQHSGEGG